MATKLDLWKVIVDGPRRGPNDYYTTRYWIFVAASDRDLARDVAWTQARILAKALREPEPESFGQTRIHREMSEEMQALRHDGEVTYFEMNIGVKLAKTPAEN